MFGLIGKLSSIMTIAFLLVLLLGCTAAPTTVPVVNTLTPVANTPIPTTLPSPTRIPAPLSTATAQPVGDFVPADLPRCDGLKAVGPFPFSWAGYAEIDMTQGKWYHYHCSSKPEDVAAFYQSKMPNPPYSWLQQNWVETTTDGKLGVYFNAVRQVWIYTWFLADINNPEASRLVISEQANAPLTLPCCGAR